MMRALRLFQAVCLAAFLTGVYSWVFFAFWWLHSGEVWLFEASVALAGGALIAGVLGVVSWAARAIVRTERNMQEVRDRLRARAAGTSYVEDASEAATIEAMRRARQNYARQRNGVGDSTLIVGDLRKGGAL